MPNLYFSRFFENAKRSCDRAELIEIVTLQKKLIFQLKYSNDSWFKVVSEIQEPFLQKQIFIFKYCNPKK